MVKERNVEEQHIVKSYVKITSLKKMSFVYQIKDYFKEYHSQS